LPQIARILLGLVFTASSIAGLMGKVPPPEPEAARAFMTSLADSGLILIVKVVELLAGLALLSGFFVPLALLMLVPIIFNIGFFHFVLDPSGIPVVIIILVLWVGAAKGHHHRLMPLLERK